jgi:hypothetical protein
MSEALDLRSISAGVVTNAIYGALLFIAKWSSKKLQRAHPGAKRFLLVVIVLITIAANLILYYLSAALFPTFGTILLLIVFYVFWSQLKQFWDVGLIGADRTIHDGIDYRRSLSMCNNSLSFLGVGARKLTEVGHEFEDAIRRCNRSTRPIRFLLCRPNSQLLEKAAHGAGRQPDEYRRRVTESLRVIADLRNHRMWNIEVRFYDVPLPLFRLMFIDEWLCLASHYVFGEGDGSRWPQLHVQRSGSPAERDVNSLYHPFLEYFERLWRTATPWDFAEYVQEAD